MRPPSLLRHRATLATTVLVLSAVSACAGTTAPAPDAGATRPTIIGSAPPPAPETVVTVPAPPCPTAPVAVVASVEQWGDIVGRIAGRCAIVTTVVKGSSGDPHEYEPTPADGAAFEAAKLVVVNGLGYDTWATKAVAASSSHPVVVDAGAVAKVADGDNPHIWYAPKHVDEVIAAVTGALRTLSPAAGAYLGERAAAWAAYAKPYTDIVASIAGRDRGKRYVATEPVFDPMAAALGFENRTPPGFVASSAHGSDPSPGDIVAFQGLLQDHQVDVMIVNTQTAGAVPSQLRAAAETAGVPIVEVTETPPAGMSFVEWQVTQLHTLDAFLSLRG